MNPMAIIKTVAGILASAGLGTAAVKVAKSATPANLKLITTFTMAVGTAAASSFLGEMASRFFVDMVDKKEAQKDTPEEEG